MELNPLRKANAKKLLKEFEEAVVYKFGCLKFLISDNGSGYKNKVKQNLSESGIVYNIICP